MAEVYGTEVSHSKGIESIFEKMAREVFVSEWHYKKKKLVLLYKEFFILKIRTAKILP